VDESGTENLSSSKLLSLHIKPMVCMASSEPLELIQWVRNCAQEDEMLRRLVAQYGPRWKAISTELGSKSDSQVRL